MKITVYNEGHAGKREPAWAEYDVLWPDNFPLPRVGEHLRLLHHPQATVRNVLWDYSDVERGMRAGPRNLYITVRVGVWQ